MSKKQKIPPPHGMWQDKYGVVRVMAVAEGYVMFRRPGCVAACLHVTEFAKRYQPADAAALSQKAGDA